MFGVQAGLIASKLAPTMDLCEPNLSNATNPLWERACSRWGQTRQSITWAQA